MKYNRHYIDADEAKNDADAVRDIKEYCNEAMYEALLVETGKVAAIGTAAAFQDLNMAMGFCGIEGRPVHAWGRKYCLAAYRAWMHAGNVMTDEHGFRIKEPA